MAPSLLPASPSTNKNETTPSEETENAQAKLRVFEYTDAHHAEDLDGLLIGEHGYKYRLLENRVMPPYVTPDRYARSRRVQTRPTDICFVSYPKSGSTWLSYILVLMTENNQGATLRDSLHWVESSWTYPRSEEDLEKSSDPRIFKSHMPYGMALGGIPSQTQCRYIYIARNPKDVVTSYYHFEKEKSWAGYYGGNWDHWLDTFTRGQVQRGDWFDHVLSWWAEREHGNILFLKYEDLKQDPVSVVGEIAAFLGIELAADKLESILEKSRFQSMKSDDVLGDVKEFNKFFRKGKVGSWKEQFSGAQVEAFDRLCEERLRGTGLTFDGL
ncbi:hypothetical protein FE257_001726 [Aspergillus nanangensis]|uniref:Sulfotransferase domain-containing protein n=1 Tax=Aspergillus nanangensis TaxID=2582783 RepID=A0AAD4CDI3_ASPNN|nr:hypothetical protein FE257_001726 [Aspergillus nanangensis]